MEPDAERKVVCVTPEDHKYIEELYRKITNEYKVQATLAGVRPTIGKKGKGPKIRHVISFLHEHSVYGDREIQNFAARFVK
jgi:hypothetical protein